MRHKLFMTWAQLSALEAKPEFKGIFITFRDPFHLQINARTWMAKLNEYHISAPINEIQMDSYIHVCISTKEHLYFIPSYPNTCNSVKHFFCGTFSQREKLFALHPEAWGVAIPVGVLGMQKHCFSWQAAVAKEFNRSQNICYGLVSFPGRTIQHCEANVRTWVYIGKLKGNQASGFSLNRNKSCFGEFVKEGQGGGQYWKDSCSGKWATSNDGKQGMHLCLGWFPCSSFSLLDESEFVSASCYTEKSNLNIDDC